MKVNTLPPKGGKKGTRGHKCKCGHERFEHMLHWDNPSKNSCKGKCPCKKFVEVDSCANPLCRHKQDWHSYGSQKCHKCDCKKFESRGKTDFERGFEHGQYLMGKRPKKPQNHSSVCDDKDTPEDERIIKPLFPKSDSSGVNSPKGCGKEFSPVIKNSYEICGVERKGVLFLCDKCKKGTSKSLSSKIFVNHCSTSVIPEEICKGHKMLHEEHVRNSIKELKENIRRNMRMIPPELDKTKAMLQADMIMWHEIDEIFGSELI